MSTAVSIDFVASVRELKLLEPLQEKELASLQSTFLNPRELARELIQRSWLTPYQVNLLLQGRGQELNLGAYVVLERLGEGGMGVVLKARHRMMGRIVAVKLIRKERLANPDAVRRFDREIKAASQLTHPNIVMGLDAVQIGDTHVFVMEYVEGIDLAKLVTERGPLPFAEACLFIRQAAQGLQHALERGLVHRDIKPANLLLAKAHGVPSVGVIKILDMGLARLKGSDHAESVTMASTLTQEGAIMGSPEFMAPEQARDSRQADIRADLYSLGCTFYFLLAGRPPFAGASMAEVLLKHMMDEPEPLDRVRPDVPAGVVKIVRKLMAKDPAQRFQTPAELVHVLENVNELPPSRKSRVKGFIKAAGAAIGGSETVVAPAGTTARLPGPARSESLHRRRWLLLGGAVALLMIVGTIVSVFAFSGSGRKAADSQGSTPPDSSQQAGPAKSHTLDDLKAADIPIKERVPELKQLVAVLGETGLPGPQFKPAEGHWSFARSVAFSPDGKHLASGGLSNGQIGQILLWDFSEGKPRQRSLASVAGNVSCVTFSPDGNVAATGDFPQNLRVFSIAGNVLNARANLHPHAKATMCAAYSRKGNLFASSGVESSGQPGPIQLWSVTDGKLVKKNALFGHSELVVSMSFSPDGRLLASATGTTKMTGKDISVRVWEVQTGREIGRFATKPGPTGTAGAAVAFSPKENLLSLGTDTVYFWKPEEEKQPRRQEGSTAIQGEVWSVAFSPDGNTVASCGTTTGQVQAQTLMFWSAKTRKLRDTWKNYGNPFCVAFAPDGRHLATANSTATLYIHRLQSKQLED